VLSISWANGGKINRCSFYPPYALQLSYLLECTVNDLFELREVEVEEDED
jgi:hypothetical protein